MSRAIAVDSALSAAGRSSTRNDQPCVNPALGARTALASIRSTLAGSNRPLLITSGTGMGSAGHGQPALESIFNLEHPNPRSASAPVSKPAAPSSASMAQAPNAPISGCAPAKVFIALRWTSTYAS